jgi:hypothetical protein
MLFSLPQMEKMMSRNLKLWAGLGVVLVSAQLQSATLLAAAGEAGETATVAQADNGQGEYIAALGLVDAYLQLAAKLPDSDALSRAQKLTLDLAPLLKKHKAAIDLPALHVAVKTARGSGEDVSAHNMVVAVLSLVQNAHIEISAGEISPKLNSLSGAQKAWGLVQAAKSIMADITPQERDEHTGPLAEIDLALASVDLLWSDVTQAQPTKFLPSMLAAAAAKIEFALAAIK